MSHIFNFFLKSKIVNGSTLLPTPLLSTQKKIRSSNKVCDNDIYNMNYNMTTIKKRVDKLFITPNETCYYFANTGITNLVLTTYNEFIHNQAKLFFNILNDFETKNKITYAVFAGSAIGLVRAGKNLPWADDYDIIIFDHHVNFFINDIIPELENFGFKVKIKIKNNITVGASIFGPPFTFENINYHDTYNVSIFQCDVFFSYFDINNFLKNSGGWGLYHIKNITRNIVFPIKHHQFHGMMLPFFNDPFKEVTLCYVNIQKCSIFSHHASSTIFYKRWEHAYKDFEYIKKESIINTRKYISSLEITHELLNQRKMSNNTLFLTESDIFQELRDILFNNSNFHVSVLKKLDFLRYLYQKNIDIIVVSPLMSLQYKTEFVLKDLKHKNIIDAVDYNYTAPGLKIIADHAADIKFYLPHIKIIYQEKIDDPDGEYALSPIFYNYVDTIRTTKVRYDKLYHYQFCLSKKYGIIVPVIEIIEST